MSAHVPSITHLNEFMKSVMKKTDPPRRAGWPPIFQLPKHSNVTESTIPNLLAYQVSNLEC